VRALTAEAPIDCDEQVELAFLCSHLRNVDVNEADWMGFELRIGGLVALRLRQPTDAMPPEAAMQGLCLHSDV